MPPHCDTLDGPVVKAAKRALETGNVNLILLWVSKSHEEELTNAFKKAIKARKAGKDAQEVADFWFFETAVRLHRAGEGMPYTGLKPAGLDEGPVVPKAEEAIQKGDGEEFIHFLVHGLKEEVKNKFDLVIARKNYDENDVTAAREYVEAYLGLVPWAHGLYNAIKGGAGEHTAHEGSGGPGHEHKPALAHQHSH
jgi:hypothetical protein